MSALSWKRRLGRMRGLLPQLPNRRLVLLYHSVGGSPWAIAEGEFRAQVSWLVRYAKVEDLDALLQDDTTLGLRVAITFDDGYASLAASAAHILSDAGAAATVYLNTTLIDAAQGRRSDTESGHYPGETFLTWAEVRQLKELGWIIGSHGMEHLDLTVQPMVRVAAEPAGSRHAVEQSVSSPCRHFSYTWGRHTPALREAVRAAGYEFAAAAVHGPVPVSFDRFAFPRVNIHRDYTLEDFAAIVRGDWDFLGAWQTMRSRLA